MIPMRIRFMAEGESKLVSRPRRILQRLLCLVGGHDPVPGPCDRPEHDHCLWCGKRTPGQAARRSMEEQR